jgi:putative transposase
VSSLCRVYQVTRGGFYAWLNRPISNHACEDKQLLSLIRETHAKSRLIYGSPRIHTRLKNTGKRVGAKRVARLMRENNIKGRSATLYRRHPLLKAFYRSVPNNELKAIADAPNKVWVADVTYLKAGTQRRFLAVVMDKYSRRIVGWSLGGVRDTGLTLRALNHAAQRRRPQAGLVFHPDRGTEYSAYVFRDRLKTLGIIQSMNRPSRMNDNAHMESFFGTMKAETLHGKRFDSELTLRRAIRCYMSFYNQARDHTALGNISPIQYEQCN